MIPRKAEEITIDTRPGEPVRLLLRDGAGVEIEAVLKPDKFERIWDRICEAMALADAKGIGAIKETWKL
jgi:hypothetical protein